MGENRILLACVELRALSLQLLLRRRPEWAWRPAAVIDRPQGVVVAVNEVGRQAGVIVGQPFADARVLVGALQVGEVAPHEIERAVAAAQETLRRFSPTVEAQADAPGIFWLDAGARPRLYPSLTAWAHAILLSLTADGFYARATVGGARDRLLTTVRALHRRRVLVLGRERDEADERRTLAPATTLPLFAVRRRAVGS